MLEDMLFVGGCRDGERINVPETLYVTMPARIDKCRREIVDGVPMRTIPRTEYTIRTYRFNGGDYVQVFADVELTDCDVLKILIAKYPRP